MAIIATKSTFKKNPMLPEGDNCLFEAVISEVKDLGLRQTQYGEKHYVIARITDAKGREASRFWTPSLNEKSTLYKDYKSIKGTPPPAKLDIETLVGTQVRVLVSETTDKDGQADTHIDKLMAPKAGQNVPVTKRESKNAPQGRNEVQAAVNRSTEITDEDIPF